MWFFESDQGIAFKNSVTDYDSVPQRSRGTKSMLQFYDNNLMFDNDTLHMHMMMGGCFQVVPKTGPQPGDPHRRYALVCDNEEGVVTIEARSGIELIIKYAGEIADGTITINTTGTVNIGNDATVIRLGGGGKKISHGDHKHVTGNMGIPVPAHIIADGSDITEVD